MADDMALAAMFEYYERGGEQGRLDEPAGQPELARTRQIIARYLPPPPATVADIGGGPGPVFVVARCARLPGAAP